MVRPRRKSFYVANERLTEMVHVLNQSSQSTQPPVSRQDRSRSRNRRGTSPPNDDDHSNKPNTQRPARRQSRLMGIDEPQTNSQTKNQRRTRAKKTHNRVENVTAPSPIADEPEVNNNQRRTRSKSTHNRAEILDLQSKADGEPELANQKGNQRRGRSTSTHNRAEISDAQSTIADEPESANENGNQRRTRSKSIHNRQKNVTAQSPIVDEPEVNNNQRRTRSKSIHNRAEISDSQSTIAVEPKSANQKGNPRRGRSKSTHNRAEISDSQSPVAPELANQKGNQRRTRAKSTHVRAEISDSQSPVADEPELANENGNQRRTRSKSIHHRQKNVTAQSPIADDPESANQKGNQRRTRAKSVHNRAEISDSQSPVAPELANQNGNQRRTRAKSTHYRQENVTVQSPIVDEPELATLKGNQRRTRAKSTHVRAEISDSQSTVADEPELANNNDIGEDQTIDTQSTMPVEPENDTIQVGRPARRGKRLIAVEERVLSDNDAKRIQQRDLAVQPNANINDGNQRQTRSKSAQSHKKVAAQPAEPSKSPNRIEDVPESIPRARNKRKNANPNKLNAVQSIENRRNSIVINGHEMNDVINLEIPNQIPPARESTAIERSSEKSIPFDGPEARRIINRRCTVNIDRIDVSSFNPIEIKHEEIRHHPQQQNQQQQEDNDIEWRSTPSPSQMRPIPTPPLLEDIDLPPERVECSEMEADRVSEISTYFSEASKMSSEISVQNFSASYEDFLKCQSFVPASQMAQDDINVDIMDVDQYSRPAATQSPRDADYADDENDTDDNSSTYCSGIPGLTPINITQLLLSQTTHYHGFDFDRNSSVSDIENGSTAVNYNVDRANTTGHPHARDGANTTYNCFIDSPKVSYDKFIRYGTEKFAINCLDHGDKSIRNHFLSKFSRENVIVLNTYTQGHLWMTEVTARLYLEYSTIKKRQVKILKYYQPTMIDDVKVTAIEAPHFPGGALFLFELGDESIIHVGDFRLHCEITENEFLKATKIDEVRFDKSMLSRIFHCFPLCTDRYIAMKAEIGSFIEENQRVGLRSLIAVGAFEIGMETFLWELAMSFTTKIYMAEPQRKFLDQLVENSRSDPDDMCALLQRHVVDDRSTMIHVLHVEDISNEFLMNYISKFNCHRVLGIRPRGCDNDLGFVTDGAHKIIDVANPLIGDVSEYRRFVVEIIEKSMTTPPTPPDHENAQTSAHDDDQNLSQLARQNQN